MENLSEKSEKEKNDLPELDNYNSNYYMNFSANFYQSFNEKNISSRETKIIEEESKDSKDKIIIEFENNEKQKKEKKGNYFDINEIDKRFSFKDEFDLFEEQKEMLNISEIDKKEEDNTSNNISMLEISLCKNEIYKLYKQVNSLNKNNFFLNNYFRFPFIDNRYCIPIVKYEKGKIIFSDREKEEKFEIEEILKLILENKMFIPKKEENILKQAYFCQFHNEKYIKYSSYNNICKNCFKELNDWNINCLHKDINDNDIKDINDNDIKYIKSKLNCYKDNINIFQSKILQLIIIIIDLKNNFYNENFISVIKKKLSYKFEKIKNWLIVYVYFNIIKALILEKDEVKNNYYNDNISKSLTNALKFIREKDRNPNYLKREKYDYISKKINSLIPFYNNENKSKSNIFICVTDIGSIVIISLNFYLNNLENKERYKYNEIIEIINSKKLGEKSKPLRIMRLEKCFNFKDCQNIFLVSFNPSNYKKLGKVKIIEISYDYSKISILKTFEYYAGLINAIEINLNNVYYLLNSTNGFTLWFYDAIKNEIHYKEIIPKKAKFDNNDDNNDYKNFKSFKSVFYIEKRNILIVQITFHTQYILFFSINNDNNEFNIIFQNQIKIDKDNDPNFSDSHLNSCIIQDKYLLIGTKLKKDKKKNIIKNGNFKEKENKLKYIDSISIIEEKKTENAGVYIINLDNKKIQMEYIELCNVINCIIPVCENIFACTFELSSRFHNNSCKLYSLTTFNLEEKN